MRAGTPHQRLTVTSLDAIVRVCGLGLCSYGSPGGCLLAVTFLRAFLKRPPNFNGAEIQTRLCEEKDSITDF